MTQKTYFNHKKNIFAKFRTMLLGWLILGVIYPLSSIAQTKDVHAIYTQDWKTVGPPKGTLMVIGGSASPENYTYFMEAIGDPNAPIVFIPTAGSVFDEENMAYKHLLSAGATNVTILHTQDPKEADTEAFAAPLRKARAIFIGGGYQSRLAAAYLNTLSHRLMFEVLERGGILAGSSAGASIQGSYLYGGIQGGVGPQYVGLGFIKKSAIGQHYIRRNRMGSVAKILEKNPDLFGFGVDEATIAVVRGNELQAIGEGKVAIYDPTRPGYAAQPQEYLFAGDKYDMENRHITHRATPIPQDLWPKAEKDKWRKPSDKWRTIAPPKGTLLIYGSKKADYNSIAHFYQSIVNPHSSIVVLSTGNEDVKAENQQVVTTLRALGAQNISFLHTIDSNKANSQAFANAITKAKAVWICDSRSWQMVDSYLHTLVHKTLFDVLQRGGVIGGNGEGAAVMASRLFGEPERYNWHTGFGLLKNSLIMQSPTSKAIESAQKILDKNEALQGLELKEGSILLVEKNILKSQGNKPITIYQSSQKEPIIIFPGMTYRLVKNRTSN